MRLLRGLLPAALLTSQGYPFQASYALRTSILHLSASGSGAPVGKRAARRRRPLHNPERLAEDPVVPIDVAQLLTPESVPSDVAELTALTKHFQKLKKPQQFVALYDTVTERISPAEALAPITHALLRLQRTDIALALLQRHLRSHGSATPTRCIYTVFLALCRRGQLTEAADLLAELDALSDDAVVIGVGHARGGDGEESASALVHGSTTVGSATDAEGDVAAEAEAMGEATGEATAAREVAAETLPELISCMLVPTLALNQLQRGQATAAIALTERIGRARSKAMVPPLHLLTSLIRESGEASTLKSPLHGRHALRTRPSTHTLPALARPPTHTLPALAHPPTPCPLSPHTHLTTYC